MGTRQQCSESTSPLGSDSPTSPNMSSSPPASALKRSPSPGPSAHDIHELDDRAGKSSRTSGLSADAPAFVPTTGSPSGSSRPVKSLPKSGVLKGAKSYAPAEASVPKTAEQKDNTTRLIVVLSKACLEVYRHSSGRKGASGPGQGTRDALLNCDDHQGFLARENRDIADARPDITHQVRSGVRCEAMGALTSSCVSVFSHFSTPRSTRQADCRSTCKRPRVS